MITPHKNYLNWLALLFCATIGMTVSLYSYYQIINIPPPTTVEVRRIPKTIIVGSPKMNEQIQNPVKITGKAKSITGAILIKLVDGNGSELGDKQLPVDKEKLTSFETEIKYKKPDIKQGLVIVGQNPSNDDQPGYRKSILVKFAD